MSVFKRLLNVGKGTVSSWGKDSPDRDDLLADELRRSQPQPNDPRLARLARARDRGTLTQEQYETARAKVLLERHAEEAPAEGAARPRKDWPDEEPAQPEAPPPPEPPKPRKRSL